MNIKLDIPESFFQGEERSGYYVKPEMKKVWAVELDLLAEFARVCKKHNLKWFASGGTLLGAARHKGFIPWDDDVDVVMMRKDYERLHEIAAEEFRHPYHLSSKQELVTRALGFGKLFNEDTTMFDNAGWFYTLKHNGNLSFSQGIYIDIFPMDGVPDDEQAAAKMFREARLPAYKSYLASRLLNYYPSNIKWKRPIKAAIHFAAKVLGFVKYCSYANIKYFQKFDEAIKSGDINHNCSKVAELCWLLSTTTVKERFCTTPSSIYPRIYDRSFFSETVELPFEMLQLPAVAEYDKVLTQLYGEWREFKIQGPHGSFYDTERSYKYYYEHTEFLPN